MAIYWVVTTRMALTPHRYDEYRRASKDKGSDVVGIPALSSVNCLHLEDAYNRYFDRDIPADREVLLMQVDTSKPKDDPERFTQLERRVIRAKPTVNLSTAAKAFNGLRDSAPANPRT